MSIKEAVSKLINAYKKYGFRDFFRRLWAYIVANYLDTICFRVMLAPGKYRREIRGILQNCAYERVILWRSSFGYNVSLFQRPQHISGNFAKSGCLVFYEVTTMTDRIKLFEKKSENLYLFNFNNRALRKILMQELEGVDKPKYVQLYSTDWKLSVDDIKNYVNQGYGFIYEYIDHISPELAGTATLPKNISDKYEYVMDNPDAFVAVTADALRDDVLAKRGDVNLVCSSNGVDYGFFSKPDEDYEFEKEFTDIFEAGKPVLCYYGALAGWFDYELVKQIAATDEWSIVLFGIKYDDSYEKNMGTVKNVYFLGPRKYSVLKNYAAKADVLMIPFLVNDITRATNPVKLFEYMSLHKPIVTTDMNECRKYSSVLIGRSHEEFLDKLREAMLLRNDPEYIALLDSQARENDWSMKAGAILQLLREHEKG